VAGWISQPATCYLILGKPQNNIVSSFPSLRAETDNNLIHQTPSSRKWPILAAGIVTLLVSDLPNIIWHWFQPEPGWLYWAKVAVLTAFLMVCLAVKSLRPLWKFALIFLAFFLANWFSDQIGMTTLWQKWFGSEKTPYAAFWWGKQLIQVIFTLLLLVVTWLLLRRRQAFFLDIGQVNAELEPVPWLGIRKGQRWTKFGWIFAGIYAAGATLFVVLAYGKFLHDFGRIIPLLPLAVIFAAINAFTEEFTYRAPLLGATHEMVGRQPALVINAIFFGFAHYLYGTPNGIPGLLMTTFVGYLFGKSMLETRGSFWALFTHMLADIPIFVLYALASV
jgi:membrane protease YdiL (CAAX protease family)